jgi:hypothetical protein
MAMISADDLGIEQDSCQFLSISRAKKNEFLISIG